MYSFDDHSTQDTKDFIGYNEGIPINRPTSKGMLEGGTNVVQSKCHNPEKNISKAVPYFVPAV